MDFIALLGYAGCLSLAGDLDLVASCVIAFQLLYGFDCLCHSNLILELKIKIGGRLNSSD